MKKLTIDFETRSTADLRRCGAVAYAMDPSTEVICLALKWAGEDPVIFYAPPFRQMVDGLIDVVSPGVVSQMVAQADIIEAHNAAFEWAIWSHVMSRYGFGPLNPAKLRCSAAKAAAMGLPRDLAGACAAAGVPQQKDSEGHRLMLKLCKPRRPRKEEMLADPDWATRVYWYGTPEEFVREGEYCLQDVRAEESLSERLPDLQASEQELWLLDLEINDRGFRIDVPAIEAILGCVERHADAMTEEFRRTTGLSSPRQRDATLGFLRALGAEMEGLTAADVESALENEKDATVQRVLEIRQSLSKSSTAKYKAMLGARCPDDRVRGCFLFLGAGTGRWTGRLVQPHNFPRGQFTDVESCIEYFQADDLDSVNLLYGDPMVAASTCLRGMIVPAPGHDFIGADYSSIEGRVLAWLAGEETALDVYRSGKDPYKVAASAIYKVPYSEVSKPQRQIGKVAELALGFQGAVGAFNAMAAAYGVSMEESEIKNIVEAWRESRPLTTRYWAELESACAQAVRKPGAVFSYRGIRFTVRRGFLAMRLPSGRCLWYARPRMEKKVMPWGKEKDVIAVEGVNSVTRKWGVQYLYGGLLAENVTQATARDLLVSGMRATKAAGYPTVLHVHDELVAEAPEGSGSVEEFIKLICTLPDWAAGIPIAAEGWRGKRYRK